MSQKSNFFDKLTRFILGEPALSERELKLLSGLSQKLDTLSHRLDAVTTARPPVDPHPVSLANPPTAAPLAQDGLADMRDQVQKLAKTQFKANSLQEAQLAQTKETLDRLQQALARQDKSLAELAKQQEQAVEAAQYELLTRIIPILDSLDAAFETGRRQVLQLPTGRETRQAMIGWLDGIRLARLRLLDVLAAYDIHPIPTTGRSFDPHYHVAVAVDKTGHAADGVIVAEDRPGYASPTRVLREAEVIVARSI